MKKRRCCVRILSVFCVLSVIAAVLSGCTPEEIGFIDLINERNSASQYRIEGIYGESSDRYSEYNYDKVTDIRYIAEINRDADYMHITINGKISGVEFSEPFDYYVSGKKYYINKNIMRYNNAVLLNRNEQLANFRISNKHNDVSYLLDELDNTVLKNVNYVRVDLSGDNWEVIPIESYPSTNMFNVIYGIPFDLDEEFMRGDKNKKNVLKSADYEVWENYLNEAYSGFTTDMITEIPNGYKLEAGPERLEDTTINFAQYLYPHSEEIYNFWVYYMNVFFDSIPCSDDETRQIVEKLRNENIPEKDEFLSFAQELQEVFNYESTGTYSNSWKDEYINYSVTKVNNTYQTVQRFLEVYKKTEKPNTNQVYHEKNQTAAEVTPELPRDYISGDEYDTIYEETRRQINPPTAMEICGTILDINHPSPCMRDENGTPILSHLPMYPDFKVIYKNGNIKMINKFYANDIYENNNGNLCIPINNVAKAFDEEVVWDENSQTEAIKRGDEIITLDGVWYSPVPELSFYIIPVREFEKLGYTVEYIETKKEDCKDIKINIIKH